MLRGFNAIKHGPSGQYDTQPKLPAKLATMKRLFFIFILRWKNTKKFIFLSRKKEIEDYPLITKPKKTNVVLDDCCPIYSVDFFLVFLSFWSGEKMRETGEELIRFFVCILYTSRAGSYYILSRLVATSSPADCLAPLSFQRFSTEGGKQEVRGAAPAWPGPAKWKALGEGQVPKMTIHTNLLKINFDGN